MGYLEYKNLARFLKFFINRPNHLARYLIENNALNKEFIKKLNTIKEDKIEEGNFIPVYFLDIDQMNNFFIKLIDNKDSNSLNSFTLREDLEKELENCIKEERYEDAIRIRDYLKNIIQKREQKP